MKYLAPIAFTALVLLAGCAALQSGVDKTVGWLDAPATTQPTADGSPAPTHEQTVRIIVGTAAAATAPTPAGPIVGGVAGVLAIGLTVLHTLSSKRTATTNDKIDAVAEAVKTVTDAVAPSVASPSPATTPDTPTK